MPTPGGLPYACAMTGATQVLPGSHLIGRPLAELIEQEGVTWAAGVPTVWNLLYQHLKLHPHDLSRLRVIVVGGAALPRVLIENYARDFGVRLMHAWGLTETSPVGSVCNLKAAMEGWPDDRRLAVQVKQGIPVANLEVRLLGDEGQDLPWDGRQSGELAVRGPWVARSYYNSCEADEAFTEDGWFRTGDIASVDSFGYIEITDRTKDVVKIRGEWISSVAMENAAMHHPAVLEAAVVARPDDLRGEAPVVLVVLRRPDQPLPLQELLDVLKARFARWQLPRLTDIRIVAALPKTGVGKVDKKAIRRTLSSTRVI
jgi:fatty-acyl-CoA synthase